MLGKTVCVAVTNAIGSTDNGKTYPLNYGYIKGFRRKDGSVQPAYVFAMKNPVNSFNGTVVAILEKEDGDSVWIVAPRRMAVFEPELMESIKGAEEGIVKKDFHYEKSCGAVLYTEKQGVRHYLLVRNRSGFYGFPKGHIEGKENEHETSNREILEETGLTNVEYISGFCEINKYMCRPTTKKRVVLFLAKFPEDAIIKPSMEIDDCQLLPYSEAYNTIGHQNDKAILKRTEEFLKEKAESK